MMRVHATRIRYFLNVLNLVGRQEGWGSAAVAAVNLSYDEVRKVPRLWKLHRTRNGSAVRSSTKAPVGDMSEILRQLGESSVHVEAFALNRDAFGKHLDAFRYPRFYAGGPIAKGGFRESKLLEYFVSLELLPVEPADVVIDVASERSVFPEMVNETTGARVFRQDLMYPPGLAGDKIGGSAAAMPVPAAFAHKLFLHNSFEHFEGNIDTEFVAEAWRVLKPGGAVCIVPLYLSARHQIVTDPLLDIRDVAWDSGAEIVQKMGYRSRFGRFYSADALVKRVLEPADECGFRYEIRHLGGADQAAGDPISRAYRGLRFGLTLTKPSRDAPIEDSGLG
jgi:SAM-dependent methyltransferase